MSPDDDFHTPILWLAHTGASGYQQVRVAKALNINGVLRYAISDQPMSAEEWKNPAGSKDTQNSVCCGDRYAVSPASTLPRHYSRHLLQAIQIRRDVHL